jgi:hypothetical protein
MVSCSCPSCVACLNSRNACNNNDKNVGHKAKSDTQFLISDIYDCQKSQFAITLAARSLNSMMQVGAESARITNLHHF